MNNRLDSHWWRVVPVAALAVVAMALPGVAAASADGGFLLPPEASTLAPEVDWVFNFILWVGVAFFVVLMGAMVWFAVRYRDRGDGRRTNASKGNHMLELAWAGLPAILLVAFFITGFKTYLNQAVPPANAMEIRVTGQKWSWSFSYPESGVTAEVLRAPAGTAVRLVMSSTDVIHSFYVPDFRIKKDVLPNRYTVAWFEAPEAGEHQIFCTEYCGNGHSRMLNTVEVMEPRAFHEWERSQKNLDPSSMTSAERGAQLSKAKACSSCHTTDGTRLVGPSFKGLYGKEEAMADGSTVKVDDNYIRESLMTPGAKIVAGFGPQMPPYQGQLSDEQVNDLIDFLKSLAE